MATSQESSVGSAPAPRKAGRPEARYYKLKAGTHTAFETRKDEATGMVVTRAVKTIRSNDPKNNWIASHENLAAQEPARWEEINPPREDGDEAETDNRLVEMPPPGPPTDADLADAARLVNRGGDREARRKRLEAELEALKEEEKAASGKGSKTSPSVDEAIEHQRTLMGKSDSADAALEDWEKRAADVRAGRKGKLMTTPGEVPQGQVLGTAGDEEEPDNPDHPDNSDLKDLTHAELTKVAKEEGVEHAASANKAEIAKAIRAKRRKDAREKK